MAKAVEHGIPVDDTIARVMRKLNTKKFTSWIQAVTKATNDDVIAIDEKLYDAILIQRMINQQFIWSVPGVWLMLLY